MSVKVVVKDATLKKLSKIFGKDMPSIKIGTWEGDIATYGAVHEYGKPYPKGKGSFPVRSFLRMPLSTKLSSFIRKSGLNKKESIERVVQEKSIRPWAELLGIAGVSTVLNAFSEQGPGWAKWKNPKYKNNANMVLTATGQLRNSITYKVD